MVYFSSKKGSVFGEDNILVQMKKRYSAANSDDVLAELSKRISDDESSVHYQLIKDNPYWGYYSQIKEAKLSFAQGHNEPPAIQSDWDSFKQFAADFNITIESKNYFRKEVAKIAASHEQEHGKKKHENQLEAFNKKFNRNINIRGNAEKAKEQSAEKQQQMQQQRKALHSLLQEKWQEALDKEYARWELEQIAKYRRQLIEQLEEWLKLIQQLYDVLSQLSITPGLLFDLSKGNISLSDIEQLKQWARYFEQDEGVRRLCKMLGHLRTASRIKRRELITTTELVYENLPDVYSREEIIGVETGNSIEHSLITEKGLLADEDVELLFYLKFAEKRLMQFEMQGMMEVGKEVEKKEMKEFEEEEENGPMIICVDTSGSMQGMPETIAKAATLYISTHAAKQKRKCYLINFSTGIETLDLSEFSMSNLIKFLRMSFNGGTDPEPALAEALKTMESENYRKADVLVVSDFVMDNLSPKLSEKIVKARANRNRFYSLAIGDISIGNVLEKVFNSQWVYNPHGGGVQERKLLDMTDTVINNDNP